MSSLYIRAATVALLSWLLLSLVAWSTPQGLHFYDPVVQLVALQQHQRGESPAWNVWQRVDPGDLSHDIAEPVGWWPPSIPLLTHAVTTSTGLPLGSALRLLAVAAGAIGVIGWAVWWARFPLPAGWIFTACALLPWVRHASSALFRFSGEILAFAAAPWVFLGLAMCLARLRRVSPGLIVPALIGLGVGASYWVKYSLFVASAASLAVTILLALKSSRERRPLLAPILALALAAAVGPVALKAFHLAQSAIDPVGRANPGNVTAALVLFFFGNPVLALADASGPYFDALVYPGVGGFGGHGHAAVAWIGFPGGLLLTWLLVHAHRSKVLEPHVAIAVSVLPIFTVLMLGLWLTSDVARDTRLFIPAAFAALPAVLLTARGIWPIAHGLLRVVLLASAGIYLAVPSIYGPLYVAAKIARSRDIHPGPTGLALPSFGTADTRALVASLKIYASSTTVWIAENLEGALEIPGRCLTPISGRSVAEDMRNIYAPPDSLAHWRTSRPIEVRMISSSRQVPPALLTTLRDVGPWTAHPTAVADIVVWAATMHPRIP